MRIFYYVLLLLIISFTSEAQQVKKIDCCQNVTPKATIIINENTTNRTASSTTTNTTNLSNGVFNFELKSSLNTSAGVYNSSGVLIRTLWSGVRYDVGCYSAAWDGYLDDGVTVASVGDYTIKLLTNNVQYTWEGGIGDSSTDPLGARKLKGNDYTSLVTVGNTMYAGVGYSEHESALRTFNLSDINLPDAPSGSTEINALLLSTDENLIYIAGDKTYPAGYSSWVHAIHLRDVNLSQNPVNFTAQQSITANSGSGNLTDNNAIALSSDPASYINGLAVQKTGNFLFVARSGLNQLQVYDKHVGSGALLQTLTISGLGSIAADANTYLYTLVAGQVVKYTVNSDATLTNTNTAFIGVSNGSQVSYSAFLNRIAVFDNSTFQIKIYNPSGGAPIQIIGTAGGYTTSPYFDPAHFVDANFLYYQQDGTLWIGQPAFHTILHYNLDFTIKEGSQHLPTSRCVTADQNNPTRVYANYNEYTRDYSKPLDNGKNGSWKIAANWAKGANTTNLNYDGIVWDCTLSNGRNYALIYTGGRNQLNELTSTGPRLISDYFNGNIGRDGTVLQYGDNGSYGNQPTGIYRKVLTGFNSSNNPVWSAPVLWITNPTDHSYYTPWYGYQNATSGLTAAADRYIYFNNGTSADQSRDQSGNTIGYRLGAIKASTGNPLWKTSRTTFYNYIGPYPSNGDFDIGNNTGYLPQHSETHAMVYDNDVFWNVNGEFWQNTEANYWNHFDAKTGLLIGHFGTDGNIAGLLPGAIGQAGNAFSVQMVKVGNDYYIYHCDESVHAFIHSWHVTGLNTIQITTVPITVSTPIALSADPTNLMTGIPYQSSGFYGGSGWTMNPAAYDNHSFGAKYGNQYPDWRVTTTQNSYLKSDNDIYIESDVNANGTYRTVTRTLGSNNTNNWTFSFQYKLNTNLNGNYKLDLLDATGKILITFGTQSAFHLINGNRYQENALNANTSHYRFASFSAKNVKGQVSVSIDGYPYMNVTSNDPGGNFSTPATFRVRAGGSGDQQHTLLSVKGLKFVLN